MHKEQFRNRDRRTLEFCMYKKAHEGNVVIVLPDFGHEFAEAFYVNIMESLNKDFFVCGLHYEGHGESQGEADSLTLVSFINDVEDFITWLKKHYSIEKIGIVGAGLGGMIAALVPGKDAFAVIDGITDPDLAVDKLLSTDQLLELKDKGKCSYRFGRKTRELDLNFVKSFYDPNIREALSKIDTPALLVHGTASSIPYQESVKLRDRLKGWKKLELVQGGDFLFGDKSEMEFVMQELKEFFEERLWEKKLPY